LLKFAPAFPRKANYNGSPITFEIEGAWIWERNENATFPLVLIERLYEQRRKIKNEAEKTGIYNPMEMVLKLIINSVYGKFAQFVGERGKVPKTANPYYAAAITGYGRRRLCEAALVDPHAIVFFATDGIVSTQPLHGFDGGLSRVKIEGKDVITLGDWEYAKANGGLFVGSGIYMYWKYKFDENGEPKRDEKGNIVLKPVAKLRGANAKKYKVNEKGEPWLVENVLPIWENMVALPTPGDNSGLITRDYKQFVTIGSALSPRRWRLAGRWSPEPGEAETYKRSINAHEMGAKRMLNIYKLNELLNGDKLGIKGGIPALRTHSLIPTIPRLNHDGALSRARQPEWVCEETGKRMNDQWDMEEASAGSRAVW
jgi:hypothetical protein